MCACMCCCVCMYVLKCVHVGKYTMYSRQQYSVNVPSCFHSVLRNGLTVFHAFYGAAKMK